MVKRIIWSLKAESDLKSILIYWKKRNKSNSYSIKLNNKINEAVLTISQFPESGKPTTDKTARIKVVSNYLIIYEVLLNKIIILTIWDSRQNPKNLEF